MLSRRHTVRPPRRLSQRHHRPTPLPRQSLVILPMIQHHSERLSGRSFHQAPPSQPARSRRVIHRVPSQGPGHHPRRCRHRTAARRARHRRHSPRLQARCRPSPCHILRPCRLLVRSSRPPPCPYRPRCRGPFRRHLLRRCHALPAVGSSPIAIDRQADSAPCSKRRRLGSSQHGTVWPASRDAMVFSPSATPAAHGIPPRPAVRRRRAPDPEAES